MLFGLILRKILHESSTGRGGWVGGWGGNVIFSERGCIYNMSKHEGSTYKI